MFCLWHTAASTQRHARSSEAALDRTTGGKKTRDIMALSYTTQKSVVIKSWRLGALYYGMTMVLLAYIGYYLVYAKHGYQRTVQANANLGMKIKGQAVLRNPQTGEETVYDANDLVIMEPSGFFVATALATTLQARGECVGTDGDEVCTDDPDVCVRNGLSPSGRMTGECRPTGIRDEKRCVVQGWCPGEPEEDRVQVLENVGNFTIFTRMSVEFPGILDENGEDLFWTNLNGTEPTLGWNLFTINDLLASGGMTVDDIADVGWDGRVDVIFDCDLDQGIEACAPKTPFKMKRVIDLSSTLSKGYNTRWISAHNVGEPREVGGVRFDNVTGNGHDVRLLVKGYGPRLRFTVSGVGRKFDLLALSTTVGAGVAFLGIASVLVNVVMRYGSSAEDRKKYESWLFAEFDDGTYGSTEGK
jgi:P2X purinoceptor 4